MVVDGWLPDAGQVGAKPVEDFRVVKRSFGLAVQFGSSGVEQQQPAAVPSLRRRSCLARADLWK
jgi:hypothetical protein